MRSEHGVSLDLPSFIALINDSHIASIKTVAEGLVRLLDDPRATVRQLTDIIEIDPPLSGKILARANSAYCYSKRSIDDIEQAVLWIGLDSIKELALNQTVCDLFIGNESIYGYSRSGLWKHSVAVAIFAKALFRLEFADPGGLVYSAGLLHDIGLIAEDQLLPEVFPDILARVDAYQQDITECEFDILGFDHCQVGQALAFDWNLPKELAISIGRHGDPIPPDVSTGKAAACIHLADQVCQLNGFGYLEHHHFDEETFIACRDQLGLTVESIELILEETRSRLQAMEEQGLL